MWNNHEVNYRYGQSERNRRLAREQEHKRNFRLGILMIIVPLLTFLTLAFISKKSYAADNTINIQQIGNNNAVAILQDGSGHTSTVNLGANSNVDNTSIYIDQKDSGIKTTSVEIKSGINNGINILQQGAGNHTTNIQNLSGSGNNINIEQNGAGNHEFRVLNSIGSANSGNTITSTQSSASSQVFNLTLDGTTGATVGVSQTGAIPNIGSMTIQCAPGTCGTYTYTRN
jgi:hypothetical protein